MREIKRRAPHVQTGVLLIPLVPHLGDQEAELEATVRAAASAGADYLLFGGGMTLRDRQGLWYLDRLRETYPDLLGEYEQIYSFRYDPESYAGRHAPHHVYLAPKHEKLLSLCSQYKLAYRISRYLPSDFRATNYRVAELLLDEAYENQMFGRSWKDVFWAGQNIQNLGESLEALAARDALSTVRNLQGPIETRVRELLENAAL